MQTFENGAILLAFAGTEKRHFDFGTEEGDGGPQFMRCVACEGPHTGEGLIDALQHLIQSMGEIRYLVVCTRHGQPDIEVALVDSACLRGEFGDWPERRAAHDVTA